MHEEEFDQEISRAMSEIAPKDLAKRGLERQIGVALGLTTSPGVRGRLSWYGRDKRWGLWGAVDWIPDPSVSQTFIPQYEAYSVSQDPSWIGAVGVSWRLGK